MSKNVRVKNHTRFLTVWSTLNTVSWFMGIFIVFLVESNLEYTHKFSALRTFIIWLPLGASIGFFQWIKLKRLGIKLTAWVAITAIGFSTFFTLLDWVVNFTSFDYWEYNIPTWIIYIGEAIVTIICGVIIGGFQSFLVRKHISVAWIMGYLFAAFLAFVVGALGFAIKSVLLETLYSWGWYDIALGPIKYILLYSLMILVTSITISLFTGKSLLKHLSSDAFSRTG